MNNPNPNHGEMSADDMALHDYITGVAPKLAEPVALASADRANVAEFDALRTKVQALTLPVPVMQTNWDGILAAQSAAELPLPRGEGGVRGLGKKIGPRPSVSLGQRLNNRIFFRVAVAACICIALVIGSLMTGTLEKESYAPQPGGTSASAPQLEILKTEMDENTRSPMPNEGYFAGITAASSQRVETSVLPPLPPPPEIIFPKESATGSPLPVTEPIIREGSISLLHESPAALQQHITDEVTAAGGSIKRLARQGRDKDTRISMELAVPSDKFRSITATIAAMGEVTAQNELATDVTGEIVNYEALLAEAKDYLRRLDALAEKPSANMNELQQLERERRDTRQTIERHQGMLNQLARRTSTSTLRIELATKEVKAEVPPPPPPPVEKGVFESAWDDGVKALNLVLAFLLRAGLATLPLSALLIGILVWLRRKARKNAAV